MIISLLVRAAGSSTLARICRRGGWFFGAVRSSKSYRLVVTIGETLSVAKERSVFLRIIRKACLLLSIRPTISEGDGDTHQRGTRVLSKLLGILLSPWALPLGFLAFFWLSLVRVSSLTLLLIYLAALVMVAAICLAFKEEDLRVVNTRNIVLFLGSIMFLGGYVAFIVQIANVGGLPLLNDQLRKGLSPLLNYLAWTTVPGTAFLLASSKLDRCGAYSLTLLGFLPSFFLAFRTEMIAYILAVLAVLYHKRMLSVAHIIAGIAAAGIFFVGVGAVRSITTGLVQNPLFSVLYRPTITVAALDTMVRLYGLRPVTRGWVHLAALSSLGFIRGTRYGPRTLISIYTGGRRTVSTTSTLIGGPLLDWGWVGAIVIPFLSAYFLALSYKFSRRGEHLLGPYAVLFSYLLVGIETGILDINVYIYLLLSVIIVLLSLRPNNALN